MIHRDDLLPASTLPVPIAPQATCDSDLLSLFLANYRSANTRSAYASDLELFASFVAKPLRTLTLRDVQAFSASLALTAAATAARRLSAVKSYVAFAFRLGYVQFNVAAPVQLPVIKNTLAEKILPEADVQRLFWVTTNQRNSALLRLIYGAGLRVSEACGLRWRDLTPRDDAGQLAVLGKAGKTRFVLLPAVLWARIDALRGASGPDDAVFRSRRGGPLTRVQVHRLVKVSAKRARLSTGVSTHTLRHCHASHALDRNCPIHLVQATLGHASVATTGLYLHARPGDSSARYLNA